MSGDSEQGHQERKYEAERRDSNADSHGRPPFCIVARIERDAPVDEST